MSVCRASVNKDVYIYIDATSHLVPYSTSAHSGQQMARDINIQQITNHVIYLYNQLTETSDKFNLNRTMFWGGGKCTVQLHCALTALLTANMRLLRNVAPLLTN